MTRESLKNWFHLGAVEVLVAGAELKLLQSIICGSSDYACLGWQIWGEAACLQLPQAGGVKESYPWFVGKLIIL